MVVVARAAGVAPFPEGPGAGFGGGLFPGGGSYREIANFRSDVAIVYGIDEGAISKLGGEDQTKGVGEHVVCVGSFDSETSGEAPDSILGAEFPMVPDGIGYPRFGVISRHSIVPLVLQF